MAPSATSTEEHISTEEAVYVTINYAKTKGDVVPNHEEIQDLRSEFLDRHRVKLHDFREAKVPPSFSQSGFEVATFFPCPHGVDYDNAEHVKETYIPALEALVKTKLGASSTHLLNYRLRNRVYDAEASNRSALALNEKPPNGPFPVLRPHIDVTSTLARTYLARTFPELHNYVTKHGKHWQIVNAWKPIETVHRDPLAVVDTRTVAWEDYVTVKHPESGPDVEQWYLTRKKDGGEHAWWWVSEQTPDEVVLFRQFDSEGRQVVPHCSVQLPGPVPEEARRSIETRFIVVY